MSLLCDANTKLRPLSTVAPQSMYGATPPASRSGLSCLSVPPTITSKWLVVWPGSTVTTLISNGRNVAFTQSISSFQCGVPQRYASSSVVPAAMLERLNFELSVPTVTEQPFGMQSLMKSVFDTDVSAVVVGASRLSITRFSNTPSFFGAASAVERAIEDATIV